MNIEFTKEETLKLIEEYYKRLEGRDVVVSAKAKKECVGLYESTICVTNITVVEKIEILGMQKEFKETIDSDSLFSLIKALFELYDMEITSVSINDGINTKWEGWGCQEYKVEQPYFKGITVSVKKKKNKAFKKV